VIAIHAKASKTERTLKLLLT